MTTEAVIASNRRAAPWKTEARSARMAAGPVTWTCTPSGTASRRSARSVSTASATSVAVVEGTPTTAMAAVSSSATGTDAGGPGAPVSRPPTTSSSAGTTSAMDSAVNSTTPTEVSWEGSDSCSCTAAVLG